MNIKLLTEHHLDFLSLKGGSTGLSESTIVKMPHCWKSSRGSIRPSKKISVFRLTGLKILGRVGTHIFFS